MRQTVHGTGRLEGRLELPPDKSISHRAAMFAALAEGTSRVQNFSDADDPQSTLSCLKQLGVNIQMEGDLLRIDGVGRNGFTAPERDLDCGNSGTTMRLMSGILAGAGVASRLVGDSSLSRRTMRRVIEPLREMGGEIDGRDGEFAPLVIGSGRGIRGIRYPLPIASAQLKSAVLLAGLFGEKPTEVVETVPSRDHTERLLGLPVEDMDGKRMIRSSLEHPVPLQQYRVPGDFSAAAFWLVAGAVHPDAEIHLSGAGINPTRIAALHVLQEMGADIEIREMESKGPEPVAEITVRSSSLKAVRLDPSLIPNCIDELPVLMVAMAFAEGRSEITGAAELRYKETDRLTAMESLLAAAGERFEQRDDGIVIQGRGTHQPDIAEFESEHDHRIAMAAGVISLMADGASVVRNAESASISYPQFWEDLQKLSKSSS